MRDAGNPCVQFGGHWSRQGTVTIQFEALDGGRGVRVSDAAAGEQFDLRTDRGVTPEPAPPDEFEMPVERAVALDAGELHLPGYTTAEFLRGGEAVHRTTGPDTTEQLPRGTYEVDVSPPGAKTYVKVCGAAVAARYVDDHLYLDVDPATRLVVGVRSHHERPAATVTTTDDPRDLLRAVSTFGSALKTHTPDRSWPTLRGHPPAVERGDELDVPDAARPPGTGITIEVPPEYAPIYAAAPLAYYLGATLEAGSAPRLHAAGATREFGAGRFAAGFRDCLEHAFTLDAVVRSVGCYPFRSAQADALDARVDLDYERLFDLPLDERTAAYLDVPRSATEGLVDWHVTADVAPDPAYAPALPYVVDELAHVRSPPRRAERVSRTPEPDALVRSRTVDAAASPPSPPPPSTPSASSSSPPERVVVPEDAGTPGQVWLADGFSVGAANPTVGSYRRTLDWPSGTDPLDVHVVYNDARIDDPDEAAYDFHPTADTDVRVSQSLATSELRDALTADTDFLHFVGHVTDRGMVCPDGPLDVRTIASTGVSAFFLNGCRSYAQGYALLTAGSAGGIVTVDDVSDATASRVGRNAAMLLDAGFPLYGVLDVLDAAGVDAGRYTILGSPTLALRKSPSATPTVLHVDTGRVDGGVDPVPVTIGYAPYGENGPGGLYTSNYTTGGPQLVTAGWNRERIARAELARVLDEAPKPLLLDGELHRTDALALTDVLPDSE